MNRQSSDITISRECGHLMRGLAIMAIVFHNFCHVIPGVTSENEFEFLTTNLASLASPKPGALAWTFDILSFFGWYGVPIFMFLTGYGLVMKYERGGASWSTRGFLIDNYRKLLLLMIPGIAVLIIDTLCFSLPKGHIGLPYIADYIFQMSLLPDIVYPWLPPSPGVFWYFGLTMEFYVLYALIVRRRPKWWLWTAVILTLVMQFLTDPASESMTWLRHNATGWMSVFALGILFGRAESVSLRVQIAGIVMSVLFIFPSMLDPIGWQFSILTCVIIVIAVARLSMKIPLWRQAWIWVGRLSPMIFVAHPVARTIVLQIFPPERPELLPLVIYLLSTFILALLFRYATTLLTRRLRAR